VIAASRAQRARADGSEAGFTLIELLVYAAMAVVILALVSSFMISALRSQRDVRAVAEASTLGQLLATSVKQGVRNASGLELAERSDGSILLMARTANPGSNISWSCQAWYFDPVNGAVYTTKRSNETAITIPAGGPKGSWTVLGDGISAVAGSAVFASRPSGIDMHFSVSAGTSRQPVRVQTSAVQRTPGLVGSPCFS
jgi:type II secretory pathway pseudopilin PulG